MRLINVIQDGFDMANARDRPINSDDRRCDEREEVDCSEGDKLEDTIYDVEDHFMDRPY